ncbi:hypothetical protein BKG93_06740 [Rodentibacter ratti]|uniref:Uncharacterized protein n=1 Tax=Rodentibacter ratti TaxID=1906745 RepID=A0A1V3L3Y7_9PAST|nr:hypothetical protein BKG93_06740 [Rodentibacter ratti]
MKIQYYFKNFFAISIIVIFLIYNEAQYTVITFFCLNAILFPIAKYALERVYHHTIRRKIESISPKYRSALLRPIEYFSFAFSFFLAILISICFLIYKIIKNNQRP